MRPTLAALDEGARRLPRPPSGPPRRSSPAPTRSTARPRPAHDRRDRPAPVGEVRVRDARPTSPPPSPPPSPGTHRRGRARHHPRAPPPTPTRTHAPELFALLAREAGKTLPDAVGEVREAVDFLRYYAAEAERIGPAPRGIWACISPWNFPLAIFTGQIAAALAAGNAVLAKPADQTPLIAAPRGRAAARGRRAPHRPAAPARRPGGRRPLTADARHRRRRLHRLHRHGAQDPRSLAEHAAPGTPLIAETGGLNAMIVDSTALPEHAVRDIVTSAFRSAGQRCSALRCLYVQEDVADKLLKMLKGAMDELTLGDPWDLVDRRRPGHRRSRQGR